MRDSIPGLCVLTATMIASCSAEPIRAPAPDATCPDLAGEFREESLPREGGGFEVDNLTWIFDAAKVHDGPPLFRGGFGSKQPFEMFVKRYRITNTGDQSMSFDAYDAAGRLMRTFRLGPEEGWYCSGGIRRANADQDQRSDSARCERPYHA